MKNTAIALFALLLSAAATAATPWQKLTHPVPGSPQSIGAFSNGCIVGAQELPLQSDTYQVMRTDQRRYFGHPDLVLFIQRLSTQVHNLGLGTVLVGDMGMPAGGRFNGGHARPSVGSGCGYLPATADHALERGAAAKTAGAGSGLAGWKKRGAFAVEAGNQQPD
ncbi:UNVERIFIED_ORG: murein endopeptidase [Atlantibacter sp. SORGH_AS 304]|nr:murein endopeptidase [Atlantibacter sp. SORGH_AS_0304]